MESVEQPEQRRKKRHWVILIVSNLLSLVCLWWALRGINWREYPDEVRDINWWWIGLAAVADVTVYLWQGWRWSLLLAPVEEIPVHRSIRAIYVGLFANELLPLRAGEIIRCYLQARWSSIPFSVTLSTALIERIFDGFFLVLALFACVRFEPRLPKQMAEVTTVLACIVATGAILAGFAMFHKTRIKAALSETSWHRHLRVLIDDLHMIGHSRFLYYAAVVTIPHLLTQVVPIYALLQAYPSVDASWRVAAILTVGVRLTSAVPQAPGNLGLFQGATILLLTTAFGYPGDVARRFALVLWAAVTLPLLIVGFGALAFTGAHIGELSRHAKSFKNAQPSTKPG